MAGKENSESAWKQIKNKKPIQNFSPTNSTQIRMNKIILEEKEAMKMLTDNWEEAKNKKQALISFIKGEMYCFKMKELHWYIKNCLYKESKTCDHVQYFIMNAVQHQFRKQMGMKPSKFFQQLFSLVMIIGSALAMWKTLVIGFNTQCPVVVVLTGSMEPGYYRGDILFVTHWDQPLIPGDVVVYNLRTQAIPIVHRVLIVQQKKDGDLYILTKGDNNGGDDRLLYPKGVQWLHRSEILGKMRAYLPYAGFFTIWLNDYPWFKYAVLGLMGFFTIVAKDPQ